MSEIPRREQLEEREIKRNVLEDMKEFGRGETPEPEEDWDLVWVMSGPPIDIAEDFKAGSQKIVVDENSSEKAVQQDIAKKINESRERFETGIKIAKEVAARRLNKTVGEITLEDFKNFSPDIYWNGIDWSNDNLRQRIQEGFLDKYFFPTEKIFVAPNSGIKHTGHQFERIEDKVIEDRRKIVIVSDTYHLPRIKRYLSKKNSKVDIKKAVFYPAEPRKVPVGKAMAEIKKIPVYIERGVLEQEK